MWLTLLNGTPSNQIWASLNKNNYKNWECWGLKPFWSILKQRNDNTRGLPYQDTFANMAAINVDEYRQKSEFQLGLQDSGALLRVNIAKPCAHRNGLKCGSVFVFGWLENKNLRKRPKTVIFCLNCKTMDFKLFLDVFSIFCFLTTQKRIQTLILHLKTQL